MLSLSERCPQADVRSSSLQRESPLATVQGLGRVWADTSVGCSFVGALVSPGCTVLEGL